MATFIVQHYRACEMKRCARRNQRIVFGAYVDGSESFCSLPCLTASPLGTFCDECLEETTEESPGHTHLMEGVIGSRLAGSANRCETCHSVEQREWFWLILPLFPMKHYRCLYSTQTKYVGRRMRDQDSSEVDSADE